MKTRSILKQDTNHRINTKWMEGYDVLVELNTCGCDSLNCPFTEGNLGFIIVYSLDKQGLGGL